MEEIKKPKVIGIRKMLVIMWCVGAIAGIMFTYAQLNIKIDAPTLMSFSMITALGGVHTFRKMLEKNGKSK